MKLALLLGAVAFLGGLPWVLKALPAEPETVSPDWLVDAERRAWGEGMDGARWAQWPVRKADNVFNRQQTDRLRRRA